jgi:predicted transcriptional regulator
MRLDQNKIDRVKKVLKAKTETEALDQALNKVLQLQREQERLRRKKVMKRIIELKNRIGRVQEDPATWVRKARKERVLSYDGRD